MNKHLDKICNLRGHLQRCQMPDIENTRKTAVLTAFRLFFGCFGCFFRLFFGWLTVTHSAPFSAVFRLFSMSGIWHLCGWPRRLQDKIVDPKCFKTRQIRQFGGHILFIYLPCMGGGLGFQKESPTIARLARLFRAMPPIAR